LQRKHGGTIAEVLAHAERCRARREQLEHADVALESGEQELADACAELDALAAQLTKRRKKAAPALAEAVRARLAELAMPDATFEVELRPRPDGCGPRGADVVELMIAANPGVPPGPLREIASGGELSRVMLALLTVAHADAGDSGEGPLLVFDEIDAGIGGHTARAVGEHLRDLAAGRQLVCITHLPQVAALASRHFTIAKDTGTVPATTSVTELGGDSIVGELVRMLGAGEGDRAAKQHARQLLKAAA
jgi:DNA repair protein RecN (Recombination protein N)